MRILFTDVSRAPPQYSLTIRSIFCLACNVDATFGELLQKAFMVPDAPEGAAENEEDEDENEDEMIPDVWIKRWDTTHNSVTKTAQWWEHQDESLKIREVFERAAGGTADLSQMKRSIEVVARKGDYVVALVNDNGQELGKALGKCASSTISATNRGVKCLTPLCLDLPNTRKMKRACEHFKKIFANHEVGRVLELQSGKDVSTAPFHKFHYRPKTNPLYIELKAVGEQLSPTSPTRAETV